MNSRDSEPTGLHGLYLLIIGWLLLNCRLREGFACNTSTIAPDCLGSAE